MLQAMPGGKRFLHWCVHQGTGEAWINNVFFFKSFYQNAGSKGESCVKRLKRPNFVQKKIFIHSRRTGAKTLLRNSSLKAFTTMIDYNLRIIFYNYWFWFMNLFLQWLIMIYESFSSTIDYNLLIIFIYDWYDLWIIFSMIDWLRFFQQ